MRPFTCFSHQIGTFTWFLYQQSTQLYESGEICPRLCYVDLSSQIFSIKLSDFEWNSNHLTFDYTKESTKRHYMFNLSDDYPGEKSYISPKVSECIFCFTHRDFRIRSHDNDVVIRIVMVL